MTLRRHYVQAILAALISLLGAIPVAAQSRGERALEGAWQASIKVKQPAPPFAVDFTTLVTYSGGGTTNECNGTVGQSPAQGEWSFAGNSTFYVKWLKHVRNPQTNELIAIVRIRSRLVMKSPDEYSALDKVDVYGPDGLVAASWEANHEGTRIKAEPID